MTRYIAINKGWRRYGLEIGLIVAFWATIFILTVGQRAIDPRGPGGVSSGEVLNEGLEIALWLLLTPGIFWLSHRFGFDRGTWFRYLFLHITIAFIVAIVLNYIGHVSYHHLVRSSRRSPPEFLWTVISLRFLDEFLTYLFILSVGFARDYFWRFQERQRETLRLQEQASRLQSQLADARLQALRMQINPHFLFNTLHAVSSLVERDPRGVRRMIARLSELLRYTFETGNKHEVPLVEEMRFLEGYLEIQRIRFQGRLEVIEEVAPQALDALVPNLILQPLVENAVKHGVSRVNGMGEIEIRAWRERDQLHLSVRDNGPGLDGLNGGDGVVSGEATGVGLSNTRARLEALYGTEQSLKLEQAEGGGLVAHISIPFHTHSDLYTAALTESS